MTLKVGASFVGGIATGVAYMRMAQRNHQECDHLANELAKAKFNYNKDWDKINDPKTFPHEAREMIDEHEGRIKSLEREQERKCTGVFPQVYSLIPKEW